ncbi:hypothetical protein LTR56_012924 [Elasticomyces elasticus]|nr:hypothetical protein LTR56_012924 [Elasticomyces elasticus]KAK3668006.1 hypothetical protein LTR22_001073 [Elasticomyces elasticus]KAK4925053.1 hypothetical protein LTR49_007826 [Elasticomyces elasticus]KAK5767646.1 hypothetical protein LTS12_002147 [Elasticomyces elasticus]
MPAWLEEVPLVMAYRVAKLLATKSYLPRTASLPATFMRGGTSNGLLIHRHHLPADPKSWQPILSSCMGSPDHYGRQLNGMGSGLSSTSKVVVVSKSERVGIDVDYTFIQVGIKNGELDMAGNCGNMSAAVGPFAVDEGLIEPNPNPRNHNNNNDDGNVTVKMFNTNTSKTIHATFPITTQTTNQSNKSGTLKHDPIGSYAISGVPSTGSLITLSFLNPGGATTGKTLPTGNPIDTLTLPNGSEIEATLTDIANPGIFVRASDLNIPRDISSATLSEDVEVMDRLDTIRRAGARKMGLDPDVQSVPKIVLLSPPSAEEVGEGVNIVCRALSMGQPHRAVPLTLALNLGVSCGLEGTLGNQLAVGVEGGKKGKGRVVIAHPSGHVEVGFTKGEKDGEVQSVEMGRTGRVLMKGEVFYEV